MGGSLNSGQQMTPQFGGLLGAILGRDPRFASIFNQFQQPNPNGVSATGPFMQNQAVVQSQPAMPTIGGLLGGQLGNQQPNPPPAMGLGTLAGGGQVGPPPGSTASSFYPAPWQR